MIFKNYYHILGISTDASQIEIKKAYRKLSIKFHPDKNEGDAFLSEMFKNINEAYDVLSNPDRKRFFDESLELMNGFNEPYLNQQKTTEYELDHLKKLTQIYLEKKEQENAKLLEYNTIEDTKIKHKLSFKLLLFLWGLAISLGILLALPWNQNQTKITSSNDRDFHWVTLTPTQVFQHPDTLSIKLGQIPANITLRSNTVINEYIKIYYLDANGKINTGFLKKNQMVYRNKYTELIQNIIHPKRIIRNSDKAKEIYQIIITQDHDYNISTENDDYIVRSKNDKLQYKYVILTESIDKFNYEVDLNKDVVIKKFETMGFHFTHNSSIQSIGTDPSNCYMIVLNAVQVSKTQIQYTYTCN
jgi:curved DNA-binding protein CbpA